MSIVKHKDHMKFTLMSPKWMREWGQRLSSTAISRMVRQPAANCPKDNSTIFAAEATAITLARNHYRHIGSSSSWCSSLLWLNVLFAGNWGWKHQETFYLPYQEPALVIEWQGHTCPFLLDTKPLWHWGKWKSWPTCKRDPWSRHRPIGKCPLYRFEATGQHLHSSVGPNQGGCSCTWQRSLSRETNTGASKEIPAFNQTWRGCNHPTSNWSYIGHKVPYLVPRTADYLSHYGQTLSIDHMLLECAVLQECRDEYYTVDSLNTRENSRDLHSGIPARNGILLSDMMRFVNFNCPPDLDNIMGLE